MKVVNMFAIDWNTFLEINEESKRLGYKNTFCPFETGMEYRLAHSAPWRIGKTDVERHTLAWDSQYFECAGVNLLNFKYVDGCMRMTALVSNSNYLEGDNIVFEWDCEFGTFNNLWKQASCPAIGNIEEKVAA